MADVARRARAVQPEWAAMGFEARARIFRRCQKWILENEARVIDQIVAETGKTREDARLAEIAYVANAFGFWAKHAEAYLSDEKVRSSNPFVLGRKLIVRYAPVGVVGVIGPWNFPLSNSFGDCIPALGAGNSVILKPSEVTPLSSGLCVDMLRECGAPDDVFQVATGDGETGAALIDQVDFVMFTGSTATGKKVMARAAETLTPVSLELGGKDPMIVLSDADMERATNAAAFYSMNNGGQVCISVERAYVEAPVYDEFVAKVTEKIKGLRQGAPGEEGSVDVGAITFPSQLDLIEDHVEDAKRRGAKILTGGHARREGGRFFEPTVMVDVPADAKALREETFGPTLPIVKVTDAAEAVRLANDSPYGLAASVWTKDTEMGELVARQVEAGAVTVNDAQINYVALELPMGGWKSSGLGSRHGAGGIRKYTRQQAIMVNRFPMKKDLHMYPYKRGTSRLIGRMLKLLWGRGKRP
jgi:acyl-CoA reductase-like NAD-dependent aldehyde dehydrogenase